MKQRGIEYCHFCPYSTVLAVVVRDVFLSVIADFVVWKL